jgi:hypothetical protein
MPLPVLPFPRSARCPLVLQSRACGGLCTRGNLGKGDPLRVPRCIPSGLSGAHLFPHSHPANITRLPLGDMALGQGGGFTPEATTGRCITSQGGAFLLLPTPAMTGETSALPWTPSTLHADTCSGIAEGACLPLGTQPLPRGQPSVDWMPAMVSTMETTKGLPAPLWTPAANHTPVGGRKS